LIELCAAAVSSAEAAVIGMTAAAEVPEGHRIDTEDALAAVGRLIDNEHRADAAERTITTNVISGTFDLKTALSVLELARAIERATDQLWPASDIFSATASWLTCPQSSGARWRSSK